MLDKYDAGGRKAPLQMREACCRYNTRRHEGFDTNLLESNAQVDVHHICRALVDQDVVAVPVPQPDNVPCNTILLLCDHVQHTVAGAAAVYSGPSSFHTSCHLCAKDHLLCSVCLAYILSAAAVQALRCARQVAAPAMEETATLRV